MLPYKLLRWNWFLPKPTLIQYSGLLPNKIVGIMLHLYFFTDPVSYPAIISDGMLAGTPVDPTMNPRRQDNEMV